MNLFDILKNLTETKVSYDNLTEDGIKQINPFMLNKYLSMNKDYVEIVNYVQFIPYEEKEKYYKIYLGLIPQKKVWLNYIKSKNKSQSKDLLKELSSYFECSQREVKEYLTILTKEQIKEILEEKGIEEKDIQKLLK